MSYSKFDRMTFWLAGTDRDVVQIACLSDNDMSEQKNFGYTVAISTVIAFFVSLLLFQLVLKGIGKPENYAYLAAFVWAAFINYTDRMLFKKAGSQLYFRLVMLIFNALVMSIGYQIYEADAQIEAYIRKEAGTVNQSVFDERDKKRKVLTDKIEDLQERINEIWNDPTIRYKTKTVEPLKAMIKEKKEELQKFDAEQAKQMKDLTHEADLSFSYKAKVFWANFLFQSFFGVLVSLLVAFFEGLPLGLRLANHQSDYLAFIKKKSRIPMAQWHNFTRQQKFQFYSEAMEENRKDENDSDNNGNGDDLFPPYNFKNA